MVTKIVGDDNFDTSDTLGNTGWGEVKTMGMLGDASGSTKNIGDTISGSNLTRAYSVYPFQYATITGGLSGTWRVMGYNAAGIYGTICVRIS